MKLHFLLQNTRPTYNRNMCSDLELTPMENLWRHVKPTQELRFSGFVKCQSVNCSGEKYKDQESQIKTIKRK